MSLTGCEHTGGHGDCLMCAGRGMPATLDELTRLRAEVEDFRKAYDKKSVQLLEQDKAVRKLNAEVAALKAERPTKDEIAEMNILNEHLKAEVERLKGLRSIMGAQLAQKNEQLTAAHAERVRGVVDAAEMLLNWRNDPEKREVAADCLYGALKDFDRDANTGCCSGCPDCKGITWDGVGD